MQIVGPREWPSCAEARDRPEHDHQPGRRTPNASWPEEGTDTAIAGARPCVAPSGACWRIRCRADSPGPAGQASSVVDVTVSEDGEELVFSEGTGSIPAPRKRDSIARDAELLLTNYDLGHAGVGSGRGAGTPAGSLAGGE
ncbi:MAG: hypothetical protein ACLTDR_14670 [Adlercreutzia equolifaciens]